MKSVKILGSLLAAASSIGVVAPVTLSSCSNKKMPTWDNVDFTFECDDKYKYEILEKSVEEIRNSEGVHVFNKLHIKIKFTEKLKYNGKKVHKPLTLENFKQRTWYGDGSYNKLYTWVPEWDAKVTDNVLEYAFEMDEDDKKHVLTMGGLEISDDISFQDIVDIAAQGVNVVKKYFSLGDVKTIKFNNIDHKVGMVGFGFDNYQKDGQTQPVPITFEFCNMLVESHESYTTKVYRSDWNSSQDNSNYLNSTVYNLLNTLKDKLDPVIKNNLKTVERKVLVKSGNNWVAQTYNSNFFLPSLSYVNSVERLQNAADGYKCVSKDIFSAEGSIYPWYSSERYQLSATDGNPVNSSYWKSWAIDDPILFDNEGLKGAWYSTPIASNVGPDFWSSFDYRNRGALCSMGYSGENPNHVSPTAPFVNMRDGSLPAGGLRPWFCI